MSDGTTDIDRKRLRRVIGVVRSWDGPNSRLGLEMDLNQMPWGPFDALGQHLDLLLPAYREFTPGGHEVESDIARALRHVEHAADRCGEFARTSESDRETWLSSQQTWEWIRRYLTRLWVQEQVQGDTEELLGKKLGDGEEGAERPAPTVPLGSHSPELPSMPGAAATLKAAAKALRTTSLSAWRETVGRGDPNAPTREEAIQTLLGVANLLDVRPREDVILEEAATPNKVPGQTKESEGETSHPDGAEFGEELEFEPVSIEFAEGYDSGYRMGRRVGWALGSRHRADVTKRDDSVTTR
jgi:hypothetical protein